MPTYDYRCEACGHAFEELQSFSDAPLKKCPQCKKNRLERLLGTGAAILFKGSGFYQTDYRSETYKSAAKADQAQATGKTDTTAPATTTAASDTAGTTKAEPAKSTPKKAKS